MAKTAEGKAEKLKTFGLDDTQASALADYITLSLPTIVQAELKKFDTQSGPMGKTIRNVELFRSGEWNGDEYTGDDLDGMIEAFDQVGFNVPVKLGHNTEDGAPAVGWVENLRRDGDVLLADLVDVPLEVYDAVRARRYDAVSSELYWNLERDKKKYGRVLKAVALLGADTPAVAGLKPLREAAFRLGEDYEKLVTLTMGEKAMAEKKTETPEVKTPSIDPLEAKRLREDNEAMVARLAQIEDERRSEKIEAKVAALSIPSLRSTVRGLYELAMKSGVKVMKFSLEQGKEAVDVEPVKVVDDLVARLNSPVGTLLRELSVGRTDHRTDAAAIDDAGAELDRMAKALMASKSVKSYSEAFAQVRRDPANAELVARYVKE